MHSEKSGECEDLFDFYFTSFICEVACVRGQEGATQRTKAWIGSVYYSLSFSYECTSISVVRGETLKDLAFHEVLADVRRFFRRVAIFIVGKQCHVASCLVLFVLERRLIFSGEY